MGVGVHVVSSRLILCYVHIMLVSILLNFLWKIKELFDFIMLQIFFFLSGLELTFFSGVYGTCIAQNIHFRENRKGLLGISGMLIGAGEIIGQCRVTLVSSCCFFNGICQWFVSSQFVCVYVLLLLQFICLQCTKPETFWNKLIIIMWS